MLAWSTLNAASLRRTCCFRSEPSIQLLPDWREELRRCHEDYHMPGIRLHPNYHGYRLDDPVCGELLKLAAQRGLIVQLAVRMEDVRMQHPLMRVPDVDTKPLPDLVAARPELRLVLLNAMQVLPSDTLTALVGTGRVYLRSQRWKAWVASPVC